MKISTITLFLILSIIAPCTTAIEQPKKMNAVQNIWSRMYHGVRSGFKKTKDLFYSSRLFAGYHSTPEQKETARQELEKLLLKKEVYNDELTATTDETKRTALYKDVADLNAQIREQKIILGQEWTTTRKLVYGGTAAAGLALGGMKFLNLKTNQQPTDTLPNFQELVLKPKAELEPDKLNLDGLFTYGNEIIKIWSSYHAYLIKHQEDKSKRIETIKDQYNTVDDYISSAINPTFEARGYTWDNTQKTWIWNNPVLIEFSKLKFKTKEELNDPTVEINELLTYEKKMYQIFDAYATYIGAKGNKTKADWIEKRKQKKLLLTNTNDTFDAVKGRGYTWNSAQEKWIKN